MWRWTMSHSDNKEDKYCADDLMLHERLARVETELRLNRDLQLATKKSVDKLADEINKKSTETDKEITALKVSTTKIQSSLKHLKVFIFILITTASPSLVNTIGKVFL